MSLINAAVLTGLTITPSGGSALTFASAGNLSNNKVTLYVPADTDLRLRRSMDVSVKMPAVSVNAPNGYTQARAAFLYKLPKLLANGKITVGTARIEFAYDIEYTQTEIQQMLDVAAQICFDADFTPTTKALSLA